jgi:hypothetical protein
MHCSSDVRLRPAELQEEIRSKNITAATADSAALLFIAAVDLIGGFKA